MRKHLICMILCLLLLACTPHALGAVFAGTEMPDFTVETTQGTVSLSGALAEKKAVVVNFWASWCGYCIEEFPLFQEAYEQFGEDVQFIALTVEAKDGDAQIRSVQQSLGLNFPMGRDTAGLGAMYVRGGIPVTLVVDRFGKIAYEQTGAFQRSSELKNLLSALTSDGYTESVVYTEPPAAQVTAAGETGDALSRALNAEGSSLVFANPDDAHTWPMQVFEDGTRTGVCSSNGGEDDTLSAVRTVLTSSEGEAFCVDVRSSSLGGLDVGQLIVDGTVVRVFSGERDWHRVVYPLEAGEHEVMLTYRKLHYGAEGQDSVWYSGACLAKAETEEKENPAKQLAGKLASKIAEKKADFEQKRQEKLEQQQGDSSVPRNVYGEEPLDKKTLAIACVIALVVVLGITQLFFSMNDGAGSGGVVVSEDAPVVYFESGGADGGAMTPLRVEADRQVTVPKCGYIYTGHTFMGWRDPDAHLLVPGSVIRVTTDMTLTAVWDTDQRAISFNAAGGDGAMESVHVPRGISFTVPKCAFTWDGHFFSYWITNSGVTYLPGDVPAAKVEEAPEVGVLSADTLPNMWSGSFEVHSDAVEGGTFWRSVVIEFSEHNADGLVAGAATVGVLDDVPGAASGSYFFEGIIDWQTGHIEIVGTGWADQGTLTDMGGFRGMVDPNTNTMSGEWFDPNNIVLPGLWQVAAM